MRKAIFFLFALWAFACAAQAPKQSTYRWTKFVQVEGQPEAVPVEWVSTPEGRFAHSLEIPNPVPKESGHRLGTTSEEYFQHLCSTEAGEFIFKTVNNVDGLFFARPPRRPSDDDLKARFVLEAPEIERTFSLLPARAEKRAALFIEPPRRLFRYVEEPNQINDGHSLFSKSFGYSGGKTPMKVKTINKLASRFGITWRGLLRPGDRELGISGGEWIVYDLESKEILAVMRNFGITGRTRNVPDGIWWLNALSCPIFAEKYRSPTGEKIYDFVSKSLKPVQNFQ